MEPFLGQILITSFTYAPKGFALANGQLLPIAQNRSLFALYGTNFGGDGRTNFALPNLQGRVPIHRDNTYRQGATGGATTHTLAAAELPAHTHSVVADTAAGVAAPSPTSRLAASDGGSFYGPPNNLQPMAPNAVSATGGSAHDNTAPTLVLNYCVALVGSYPSPD